MVLIESSRDRGAAPGGAGGARGAVNDLSVFVAGVELIEDCGTGLSSVRLASSESIDFEISFLPMFLSIDVLSDGPSIEGLDELASLSSELKG